MKRVLASLLVATSTLHAIELTLTSPLDYQIVQRSSPVRGLVRIIGEVFMIAGQTNSANHGAEKQTTKTRRVASFDGKVWRIADSPQPGVVQVPGLVIFGEDDPFLARPSKEENLAVVPALRKKHRALCNIAVETKTRHGPDEKTWPLIPLNDIHENCIHKYLPFGDAHHAASGRYQTQHPRHLCR